MELFFSYTNDLAATLYSIFLRHDNTFDIPMPVRRSRPGQEHFFVDTSDEILREAINYCVNIGMIVSVVASATASNATTSASETWVNWTTPSLHFNTDRLNSTRAGLNLENFLVSSPEPFEIKKEVASKYSKIWVKVTDLLKFENPIFSVFNKKGFQETPEEDVIGIEFENELENFPREHAGHKSFTISSDNSLRNIGVEYVLRVPSSIDIVKNASKELLSEFIKLKPNNSTRASTHIHFDVTKMNYVQVMLFSVSYFFIEEILSMYAGDSRQNNLFCQRLVDSRQIGNCLQQELLNRKPYSTMLFNDSFRYAALNLSSINKFGSLEFRMFPSVSDTEKLNVWIDALNNIRLASLRFSV